MAGNINDCLADTNCIGMVENVDTRKVVVGGGRSTKYIKNQRYCCFGWK